VIRSFIVLKQEGGRGRPWPAGGSRANGPIAARGDHCGRALLPLGGCGAGDPTLEQR